MRRVILFLFVLLLMSFTAKHPFYLGITEMKYKEEEKSLQSTIKLFTNDLEDALKKLYKTKVDLINGNDKESITTILEDYLKNRFVVKVNGASQTFELIGFEQESDAVWIYGEFKNCPTPKKIDIENSLLYDYLKSQINIVHIEVGTEKKSSKVSWPEKSITLEF